jgi:hypothetical protein
MKVKIGAFDYDLEEVPSVINKAGEECFGLCKQDLLTIRIEESGGNARKLNTYLHEVLEALNSLYGFDLTHAQVIGISGSLGQVLQENPELTNRLQELWKLEYIKYSPMINIKGEEG